MSDNNNSYVPPSVALAATFVTGFVAGFVMFSVMHRSARASKRRKAITRELTNSANAQPNLSLENIAANNARTNRSFINIAYLTVSSTWQEIRNNLNARYISIRNRYNNILLKGNNVLLASKNFYRTSLALKLAVEEASNRLNEFSTASDELSNSISEARNELPTGWQVFKWIGYFFSFLMFWRYKADIATATYNAGSAAVNYMSGTTLAQPVTAPVQIIVPPNVAFVPGYSAHANAAQTFANLTTVTQAHSTAPTLIAPIPHA